MRNKSAKSQLGSLVFVFESVVVFFATLVAFGLKVYPEPATIWAVGLGIAFTLMILPAVLGKPGTYFVGWLMQLVVLSLGFWVPLMFVLGVIFLGMWVWGMIAGATIDKAKQVLQNKQKASEGE